MTKIAGKVLLLLLPSFFCLGLLVSSGGCDRPSSETFVPVLNVHGLLLAGADTLSMYINRTYGINERFEPDFPSVSVEVWRGRDTWQLTHREGSYYSSSARLTIRSFDTFYFRASKAGFAPVTGHTFVPGAFHILWPRPGDSVSSRDSLVWTRSRHAKGYFLAFRQIVGRETLHVKLPVPNDSIPGLPYDTATARIPLFFLSQQPEGHFTVHLWACDTNYYDWVEGIARNRSGLDSTRINGGVGVFGSAYACSVRVYILNPPPYSNLKRSNR